jgi:lipopolysaccharide export LptBFGC system permease protein LptF
MVLAFSYIAFTEISQAVGVNTAIPAQVIGWSANIVFGMAAILTMVFTRK